MNRYRITYDNSEMQKHGNTAVAFRVEASESVAKRNFEKESSFRVLEIELVETDVPASKEQERTALEKIKAIVATLGPNSYIETAFQGCFEIAEENIENDFARSSMKDRLDAAEHRAEELEQGYLSLKNQLEESQAKVRHQSEEMQRVRHDLATARSKAITPTLYKGLYMILDGKIQATVCGMEHSADRMADLASNPEDIEFQRAVSTYRKYRNQKENAVQLLAQLEQIEPEEE